MTTFQGSLSIFITVFTVILALVIVAVVISLNATRIARWVVSMNRFFPGSRAIGDQRKQTLVRLYASLVTFLAILIVIVGTLRIFVDPSQIVWIIGLFSAGFGLGARVLVSDLLAGATYIFRNTFSIGEKTEFWVGAGTVEGLVEDVNMRSTLVRAPSGELYTVPNGEISVIRNFTRARFSGGQLKVKVPTEQLTLAMQTLQALGEQAMALFPDQVEPWQILLTEDQLGATTTLTVVGKFTFGNAAPHKPRVAALIFEGLSSAGVRVQD